MKSPGRIELNQAQTDGLIEKIKNNHLSDPDRDLLIELIYAFGWMNRSLEEKSLSIKRLQKIFGIQTEKASHLLDQIEKELEKNQEPESVDSNPSGPETDRKDPSKKGHGRLSAEAYGSAKKIDYPHNSLKTGMRCPGCERGNLCSLPSGKLLRITAMPPIQATVHQPERMRCATCGEVYTAEVPKEVGTQKFDESACSMVALFRYGYGLPLNRLAHFQKVLGMPLAAGTQWELITRVSEAIFPLFDRLLQIAAQGELFYNDDTNMKVLSLMKEQKQAKMNGTNLERTGMFTTGIVACVHGRKIMLFFSGRKHSGENLDDLLERREEHHDVPLQMCDALSRNEPSSAKTLVANCLTHGRRNFYDLYSVFPEQVKFVIGTLKDVYLNEALTKIKKMSFQERLEFHQQNSAPHMKLLEDWMDDQVVNKKVEPNSSLGKAIQYMKNHWEKLTCFLKIRGAPLTNDECERLLKTAIRHRKNSLFYKNESGAKVGDILMSVIQTAEQAGVNPFDYLTVLQKNHAAVAKNPEQWLPWNYEDTLKAQALEPDGASP